MAAAINRSFRTLLLVLPFLALVGCGESPDLADIAQIDPASNPCAKYGCEGEFIGGVTWKDARGENALVISQNFVDSLETPVNNLIVSRYVVTYDVPKQTWTGRHTMENRCDRGKGLIGEPIVRDMDQNGIAEVLYVYNVAGNCDVSPLEYGLVLHDGKQLYEIDGNDGLSVNTEIPGNGEMKLSPDFATAPDTFRIAAEALWNERVPHE